MKNVKVDRLLQTGLALLTATLCGLLYSAIHERLVVAGDSAPKFSIVTDSGRTVSLPDFGGKVLVLNFWATWCPPCVEEMPSLNAMSARFRGRGVVVLGVSVDKDPKAYKQFLDKLQPAFLTARDPDQKINQDYGTVQYPETYIIDSHGKVVEKLIAAQNWMDEGIVKRVESLL